MLLIKELLAQDSFVSPPSVLKDPRARSNFVVAEVKVPPRKLDL